MAPIVPGRSCEPGTSAGTGCRRGGVPLRVNRAAARGAGRRNADVAFPL